MLVPGRKLTRLEKNQAGHSVTSDLTAACNRVNVIAGSTTRNTHRLAKAIALKFNSQRLYSSNPQHVKACLLNIGWKKIFAWARLALESMIN